MKIAVNTRILLPNQLTGVGWFTYESLLRITQQHPEHEFIFIFDRKYSEEFIFSRNITPVVLYPQARHPFLWYYWFEFAIPKLLRKLKPDLFLSPDGYSTLSTDVKCLPVIHDINFAHNPQDVPFLVQRYYNHYFPKFAKTAARIATVSEFSKQDICQTYNIEASKIDVVYNGSNSLYKPLTDNEKGDAKKRYANGNDYFIFVGTLHPRKNISVLFKSFDWFKKSVSSEVKLLIVGEKLFKTNDIELTYSKMQFKDDVIFTGRLEPENLCFALGGALALTFVPYFEGFGIPIIEAMNCNVPVITSNVTSMPEVAGEAALLVDPYSVESVKDAMVKMVKDVPLRNQLVERGKLQCQKFSWQKTADRLWESIVNTKGS